jgi:2-oxoglutarate ferredoxin oxidoreductase subunit alpha
VRDVVVKIGGAAGDGVASSGETLAKTFSRHGLHVFAYNSYQSVIRGGHVWIMVRGGEEKVHSHGDRVDFLVALNQDTINRNLGKVDVGVIRDEAQTKLEPSGLKEGCRDLPMPLLQLARKLGGSPLIKNTVALGALIRLLRMDLEVFNGVLRDIFGEKKKEVLESNLGAAQAGYDYAKEHYPKVEFKLNYNPSIKRMVMTGNQAIGLGALAAGCKFYSAYPMTPASSILHWLAAYGPPTGAVIKQAEDEIAVVNMAIGAGFAGVRAMCATSGGGFSLMTEAVGEAAMTETPVVIINNQRAGPSTGLPTKTEQADLFQALGASQGDYPKVVMAPRNVVDCFYTIGEAFNLAERYQIPVIVLGDLYLGEHLETVDQEQLDFAAVKIDRGEVVKEVDGKYLRYQITETGVSPRALPGTPGGEHVAATDEHWEDGVLISDWYTDEAKRKAMVEKRMRKMKWIIKDLPPPELEGDPEPEVVVVGWGSTYGPIKDAVRELQEEGIRVGHLHIKYLMPFHSTEVGQILRKAECVLDVENNYTAQLARLIRMETGYEIPHRLLKYDGEPFNPGMIVDKVIEVVRGG